MAAAVFFLDRTGKMAKEASGLQRRKYGRRKHCENAGFRAPRDSLRLDAKGMPPTHANSPEIGFGAAILGEREELRLLE